MTDLERRINSCIDHINTAVDVDAWAQELAEQALRYMLFMSSQHNCNDCGRKGCDIRPDWGKAARVNCYKWEEKYQTAAAKAAEDVGGTIMDETKLLPCPFCGAIPVIEWDPWHDISPTAGIWQLQAIHKDGCYIRHMNGTNSTGCTSAINKNVLIEFWNKRVADMPGTWKVYETADTEEEQPIAWQCSKCSEVVECKYKFCPECGSRNGG